jgi:DNA-binding response OmpR family regulator
MPSHGDPTEAPAVPTLGSPRVLLVDDDPLLRTMMARVLLDAGMAVTESSSRDEALRVVEQPLRAPELLLVRAAIGGLSSVAFADLARRIRPQVKVLFVSGRPPRGAGATTIGRTFTASPFDAAAFADRVRQELA